MKVLIDIPEKQYNLIPQLRRSVIRHYADKDMIEAIIHSIADAIFYGRVLNETEAKKIDEIINPHNYTHIGGYTYKNGCCSCPHSGSIIDGYRDCPDAYTKQAQHCGFYNIGE